MKPFIATPASPPVRPWLVAILALVPLLLLGGCENREEPAASLPSAQAREEVTFCHGSVTDILPRIALELGYFHEEGLKVTLKDLSDGGQAFSGLLGGDCDFSVCGAPPITLHDPSTANFTILATVMHDDDATRIIARRDQGIAVPGDLKGRRIGVKRGILGHLFLDLFLMKHGLAQEEVIMVDLPSEDLPQALADGRIDAFSMTNKMVAATARALGEQAIVFSEPGLNVIFGILTTRADRPASLRATPGLLKAMLRAEGYVHDNPEASKALLARTYGFSQAQVEDIWRRTTIELALANSVFVNLEDQYRWQVERGFAPAFPSFPNFLHVVSPEYLRAIKADAVSVVKK